MIDNMAEFSEGGQVCCQFVIEQNGERGVGGIAKPFKNVNMPRITDRQRDTVVTMNPLEDIFNAAVKLG
jgi:hypothetical protein